MVTTSCLAESMNLLERAIRTRGLRMSIINGRIWSISNDYTGFQLTFMPGNRRVLISSNVRVYFEYRGKGYGRKGLALREEIAREAGVNLLMATVRNDNVIENHLLSTSGWKKLLDRSETKVSLWGKEL